MREIYYRWEASRCSFYSLVAYELPVCLVHTRSSIHFSLPSLSHSRHFECNDRRLDVSWDFFFLRNSVRSKGIGSNFCFFMLLNYFHASNFSRVSAIGRGKIFEKNIDRAYVYNGEIREKFFIRIITSTRRGDDRSILVYLYVLQLNQFFFFFYSNNSLFHIFEIQFYFTVNHFTS